MLQQSQGLVEVRAVLAQGSKEDMKCVCTARWEAALVRDGRVQVWVVVEALNGMAQWRSLIARRSGHARRLRHVPVREIRSVVSSEDTAIRQ